MNMAFTAALLIAGRCHTVPPPQGSAKSELESNFDLHESKLPIGELKFFDGVPTTPPNRQSSMTTRPMARAAGLSLDNVGGG